MSSDSNGETTAVVEQTHKKVGVPTDPIGPKGFEFKTIESMWWFAQRVVSSDLAPKDCEQPQDALVRMQMGMEVGLHPMQALQNIANINGRPSIWGPALKALILASGKCEKWDFRFDGPDDDTYPDNFTAVVTVKRFGLSEKEFKFSVGDAKRAKLWMNQKKDPWIKYPKDMLLYRAGGRAGKFEFPDVLGGLSVAEEVRDIDPVNTEPNKLKQVTSLDDLADELENEQVDAPLVEDADTADETPEPVPNTGGAVRTEEPPQKPGYDPDYEGLYKACEVRLTRLNATKADLGKLYDKAGALEHDLDTLNTEQLEQFCVVLDEAIGSMAK